MLKDEQNMKTIKIQEELNQWLVEYITSSIHSMEAEDSEEFNQWAKSYPREAVQMIVDAECMNDWGYEERSEISEEEAARYAGVLIQRIVSSWHL